MKTKKKFLISSLIFAMSSAFIFAGGAKDKETTSSIIRETITDRDHNIYNQPYDPDAKINSGKDGTKVGPFTVKVNASDGWLYVRDSKNATLGSYSLKYQFWNSYSSVLNSVDLNLAQFYRSIDLSKTDLNRDKNGNFCGYTGAPLPAVYTEPQEEKKDGGTQTASTKTGSGTTASTTSTTGTTGGSSANSSSGKTSTTSGASATGSTSSSGGKTSTSSGTSATGSTASTTKPSTTSTSNSSSSSGTSTGSSTNNTSTGNTSSSSSTGTSSGGKTSTTSGSSSTSTTAATSSTSTAATANAPNSDKNLVFTAKKHPAVKDYGTLDAQVQKIKCANSMSIENAAQKIIAPAKSDMEKARALFTWIACNVVYDYDAYNLMQSGKSGGEAVTASGAWKNRKAVCQGISELYIQMAKAVGLEAEYVSGYAKNSDDYTPGMALENHGWVMVRVGGNPVLLDATWACVKSLNDLSSFNDSWFDCDPYLFAFSHYPKDTKKLFISDSLTKERFDSLPMVNPGFKKLGIDGQELYDFFKKNPGAWVPKTNQSFFKIQGLQINKMPFTNSLVSSQSYVFNFTFNEQSYMKMGGKELKPGTDFTYVPALTGLVSVSYELASVLTYETEFTLIPNWSGEYFGKSNAAKTSLTAADGSKADNVASGRPKVIVFQNSNPSVTWNNEIYRLSDWRKKYPDVDVVVAEKDKNKTLFDKYVSLAGIPSGSITNQNIAVYIDSKNRFQFIEPVSYVSEIYDSVRDIAQATGTVGFKTNYFNKNNYQTVTLTRLDGKTVTNQADGKPKVIVNAQFLCGDEESERLVMSVLSSPNLLHDADVLIVDNKFACDSKSPLESFCKNLSLKMDSTYDKNSAYERLAFLKGKIGLGYDAELYYFGEGGCPGGTYLFPSVIYIDSANRFRWMDYGRGITASSIMERLTEIQSSVGYVPVEVTLGSVTFSKTDYSATFPVNISGLDYLLTDASFAKENQGGLGYTGVTVKTSATKAPNTSDSVTYTVTVPGGDRKFKMSIKDKTGKVIGEKVFEFTDSQFTARPLISYGYEKYSTSSDEVYLFINGNSVFKKGKSSITLSDITVTSNGTGGTVTKADIYQDLYRITLKGVKQSGTIQLKVKWSNGMYAATSDTWYSVLLKEIPKRSEPTVVSFQIDFSKVHAPTVTNSSTSGSSATSSSAGSSTTGSSTSTASTSNPPAANQGTPPTRSANFDDYTFVRKGTVSRYDYSAIDSYVKSLSIPVSMSYADAVKKITATSKTEKEKARAIFDFIAFNISYNTGKMNSGTVVISSGGVDAYYERIAKETWNDRNGVCEGYGRLFVELCKAAGLNAEYISGNNKKYSHTYKMACGNHGWNVVHVGGEHVLLDSCWAAGNTNGNEFTFKFKDEWFDVDPYVMIFSHYPADEKYQYLSPAVSREKFDVLPRIDPGVSQAGVPGKELYDFFLTHNRAWSFTEYTNFATIAKQGLTFNKILFAQTLKKNTSYTINITFPSSVDLWLFVDGGYKKITSGVDFTFKPTSTSEVSLAVKDGNAFNFLLRWTVSDSPAWSWEQTAKSVNAKLNVPVDLHK